MNGIPPGLRTLIEAAIADGLAWTTSRHELIDPANLPPEDHDAVWLYALSRSERPRPREIRIVSG